MDKKISKPVTNCNKNKYVNPDYYSFVVARTLQERDDIPCKLSTGIESIPKDGWYIERIEGDGFNNLLAHYFKLVNGFVTAREYVTIDLPASGGGAVYSCGTHNFPEY